MSALAGTIKHNAETGEVAVRTAFDEATLPNMAWLVATVGMGARNASTHDVKGWTELYVPEPPVEAEPVVTDGTASAAKDLTK